MTINFPSIPLDGSIYTDPITDISYRYSAVTNSWTVVAGTGTTPVVGVQGPQGPQGTQGTQGLPGSASSIRQESTVTIAASSGVDTLGIINLKRSCILYSIEIDTECWFTLYSDADSRTADSARSRSTAPNLNSGVISDPIFLAPGIINLQPVLTAINIESPLTISYPFKLVNDGTTGDVTIIIKYLTLQE
jgi:hypothetical protein